MVSLGNFNAHEVEPAADFDPIPAGKYLAVITESEIKPTKSGVGSYLELTFQIIDGEYKNRLIWSRLNLDNPNSTAVQIARSELSSICRAVGLMTPKDSAELHNLPLNITVKCKKRDDTGEMTNEIKGYAKRELAGGQVSQAASSVAPWKR
ncbi:MAG: DUF669 domain-containing protein [Pirellulaceae bacterium]|nr:DUF669 domain-containing protein [Pirellulaceae bacterium]